VPAADYERLDRQGDRVRLAPDPAGIHIFDRDSGENVSLPEQS
jgi:oligogalacturonide transport system ATP-binding protein